MPQDSHAQSAQDTSAQHITEALCQTLQGAHIGFCPASATAYRFPIFPTLVWPLMTRAAERRQSRNGEALVHRSAGRAFVGLPTSVLERAGVDPSDLDAPDLSAADLTDAVRRVQNSIPSFLVGGSAALVLAPTQNPNWNAGNSYRITTLALGLAAKMPFDSLKLGWQALDLSRQQPEIRIPAQIAKYVIWDKGQTAKGSYQDQQDRLLDELSRLPQIHLLGRDWSPTREGGATNFELPVSLFSLERPHTPHAPVGRMPREAIRVRLSATGCVFAYTMGRRISDLAGSQNYDSFLIGRVIDFWFHLPEAEGRLAMHLLMSPGSRKDPHDLRSPRTYAYLGRHYEDTTATGMEYLAMALGRALPALEQEPDADRSLPLPQRQQRQRQRREKWLKAQRDWRYQFPRSAKAIIENLQKSLDGLMGLSPRLYRHMIEAIAAFGPSYGCSTPIPRTESGIIPLIPKTVECKRALFAHNDSTLSETPSHPKQQEVIQRSLFEELDAVIADDSTVEPQRAEDSTVIADGSTAESRALDGWEQRTRRSEQSARRSAVEVVDFIGTSKPLSTDQFTTSSITQSVSPSAVSIPTVESPEGSHGRTDGGRSLPVEMIGLRVPSPLLTSTGFTFQASTVRSPAGGGVIQPLCPGASLAPSTPSPTAEPTAQTKQAERTTAEPSLPGVPKEPEPLAANTLSTDPTDPTDEDLWGRVVDGIAAWIGDEDARYQAEKIRERTSLTARDTWMLLEAIRVGTARWSEHKKAIGALFYATGAKTHQVIGDKTHFVGNARYEQWRDAIRDVEAQLGEQWFEKVDDPVLPPFIAERVRAKQKYRRLPLSVAQCALREQKERERKKAQEQEKAHQKSHLEDATLAVSVQADQTFDDDDYEGECANPRDPQVLWDAIRDSLASQVSKQVFQDWIEPCSAIGYDGRTLWIETPNLNTRLWIEQQLAVEFHEALFRCGFDYMRMGYAFTVRTR